MWPHGHCCLSVLGNTCFFNKILKQSEQPFRVYQTAAARFTNQSINPDAVCVLDFDFNKKYEIQALALDFVEWRDWNYKYIEVPYTDEEYNFFLEELTTSWEKIKDIEYWKEILK